MVAASPQLTVLVTSREVLQLSAEHAIPVSPLELPPAAETLSIEELIDVPAVAMFAHRVTAGNPEFRLETHNARAVAELCRQLDGLPLAIELAAARMRAMTPEEMLARLENRLAMLTGGARDLPDRQRSLQATMDWSYELLDERSQTVFRRLAVFAGGFSLEAAEAVVDPFERMVSGVLSALEILLGQSLLTRYINAEGEPRITMLETIREYAQDKMEAEENLPALRKAHAAYYRLLAQDGTSFQSIDRGDLEHFDRERANFRAALEWAVAEDEGEWGLKLATALFPFWERGYGTEEGARYLDAVLELPSSQEAVELRAHALLCTLMLYVQSCDSFDREWANKCSGEALAIYRELGNKSGQAAALVTLGVNQRQSENYDEARSLLEEALQLWEEVGQADGAARVLSNLAEVNRRTGDLDRARELYREAASRFAALGDASSAAEAMSHEAGAAREQGDPAAEQLYQGALGALRASKNDWGTARVLVELGEMAEALEDFAAAADHYREACDRFRGVGHPRGVAGVLERFAVLAARRRDDEEAMRLGAVATRLREEVGIGRDSAMGRLKSTLALEHELIGVRERLGPAASEDLWDRGRRMPLDRAVARVLGREPKTSFVC
jgi:predicted ATPase/TolA-binding protein